MQQSRKLPGNLDTSKRARGHHVRMPVASDILEQYHSQQGFVADLEDVDLVQDWLIPVPGYLSSQVLRQLYEQAHVILHYLLTHPYLYTIQ